MASKFIQLSDFKAEYKLSGDNFSDDELQLYLEKFEVQFFQELLGAELYALFVADFDSPTAGEPTLQIYKDIWDAFAIDQNNRLYKSEGMMEMLKGLIYFEYVRDQKFKNTVAGTKKLKVENSEDTGFSNSRIYKNYNNAIITYQTIQWFICDNSLSYLAYNGQKKQKNYWL